MHTHALVCVLPLKDAIPTFHRITKYFIHWLNGLLEVCNVKKVSNSTGLTAHLVTA